MKLARISSPKGPVWAAKTAAGYESVVFEDGKPVLAGEPVAEGPLLAPVQPSVIFAIGLNYRKHAEEQGAKLPDRPILFIKTPNALNHPEAPIVLPRALRSDKVDYECELGFVISRDCKNVPKERALEYVLGFTCANDVSARDWQKEWGGGQWCKAKSFDSFCPVGPYLVTTDELPDYNNLPITTKVNGELLQEGNTNDLIFDVPMLIEFLSGSTTLPAGSLVVTGTPSGVGMARTPPRWLQPGDIVEVEIPKIGVLRNPVIEETS